MTDIDPTSGPTIPGRQAPASITPSPQDAYPPDQIARLVEQVGVKKATLPVVQTIALGLLAGAFIAFGAMYATLALAGSGLGFGPSRMLAGLAFSLGLILVVVGGAELFTGNNLIVMAWAERKITTFQLGRNWTLVYLANLAGAVGSALLVHWSGTLGLGDGAVGTSAIRIGETKAALGFGEAFFRGILCNTLVCLAVWLCFAAHDVAGKILAIIFPISAFVALGFEHSIANMYLIPIAMLAGAEITVAAFLGNLVPVTLGNVVGGGVFVAAIYWLVYLYQSDGPPTRPEDGRSSAAAIDLLATRPMTSAAGRSTQPQPREHQPWPTHLPRTSVRRRSARSSSSWATSRPPRPRRSSRPAPRRARSSRRSPGWPTRAT